MPAPFLVVEALAEACDQQRLAGFETRGREWSSAVKSMWIGS